MRMNSYRYLREAFKKYAGSLHPSLLSRSVRHARVASQSGWANESRDGALIFPIIILAVGQLGAHWPSILTSIVLATR